MRDKCCRHSRISSHVCVKCMKYRDNKKLKRIVLNEELKLNMLKEENQCCHGNCSSKCQKCRIHNSDFIYNDLIVFHQ